MSLQINAQYADYDALTVEISFIACLTLVQGYFDANVLFICSGQCKVYNGDVCKMKNGKKVFVKDGMEISDIEKVVKEALAKRGHLSTQCQSYIKPLLCQLRLPDCDESSSIPKGKPICKDECLVLKTKFCKDEYSDRDKYSATSIFFDCSSLPQLTSKSGKCSTLGVPTGKILQIFLSFELSMYEVTVKSI